MTRYTVKAMKGSRCVRRADAWSVKSARQIWQRLARDFPEAVIVIYDKDNKTVPPMEEHNRQT